MIPRKIGIAVVTGLLMLAFAASAGADGEPDKYQLESVSTSLSSTQAGAHADFTTTFRLTEHDRAPFAFTRDIEVTLPPGLFGNPHAFPTCTTAQLGTGPTTSACPQDSQVGVTAITIESGSFIEPVFNMPAEGGDVVARFGFFAGPFPMTIRVRLNPGDNNLIAKVEGAPAAAGVVQASTTLWGVPGAPSHDGERITPDEAFHFEAPPGGRASNLPETPFMTNPASCDETREVGFVLTSYELPQFPVSGSALFPSITGCGLVGFAPQTSAKPTSEQASTGTGLDYEASFPATGLEYGSLLYDSEAKRAEVVLPEGMTVNPSEAVGLGVCSEADLARETYDSPPNAGCPETSKIGTITAPSPVLDRTPEGALYLAAPHANPFGTLLALYLVVKVPDRGVLVKVAGEVLPDPVTGRLTSVFDNIPQLPVGSFRLHFREGARAPLVTPPVCGTFNTISRLEPWSAPGTDVVRENSFQITKGVENGPCPSGGIPPFVPTLVAGAENNYAGAYSPLYLRIERKDSEQEITGFATQLPSGLTGNLTGIPFCSEAEIQRARQQTGAEALASPACPAASQIGHTIAEAGVGSVLAQTPGELYLGGPFEGAPFSLVSVTSAKVGPFDLGTVVVHLPLHIDPATAQISVPSGPADQIPHILQGIVIHLRAIRVYVDRAHFIVNPTSCDSRSLSATVIGGGASPTNPADDDPVTIKDPFQAADCSSLAFKPSFHVSTSGKTSKAGGASLSVKLSFPAGSLGSEANIAKVKVDLPKQLPSRLTTLQKACLAVTFEANPAECPAASIIGHAKAVTPILPVPIEGPAYFVSHGGEAFPSLVMVLQGYGVTIDLTATTFISKAGITSSTFKAVPDQPVSSFELTLPEGKYSALAANGNLCASKLAMPTAFTAQNGAEIHESTPIAVEGCSSSLSFTHEIEKRTVTLRVSAPAAGKITASGKGLTAKSETAKGRESLTITLKQKHAGKLKTRIKVAFTPSAGKDRKKQAKSVKVAFRK
jgi:hypothetical protein